MRGLFGTIFRSFLAENAFCRSIILNVTCKVTIACQTFTSDQGRIARKTPTARWRLPGL